MRILVTGAGGMLGRDVVRAAERAGHDAIALPRPELDVTDAAAVFERVADARPDAIVNCAAYTDVDGAERDPEAAMRVNAEGAGIAAAAAAAARARVVYLSSDYVFDGAKGAPYLESDEPGPLSAYGRSKLAGERATAEATPRHLVVRSSWLFGTGGRNFVETMLSLGRERGELRVVTDQVGCPTYTPHLAAGLVDLIEAGALGTCHVAGGGACSWFEFAVEILSRAGVAALVEPCASEELPRPAPRPAYSALGSERPDAPRLPHWTAGLAAYFVERGAVPA
ncbi:MAG: dTDP-4-dehydrorhamnose reductase [Actinomycetota bacterium]|nr:dTDP-4-dehydrorhamnose reductase [Actinomycetota bacterium]